MKKLLILLLLVGNCYGAQWEMVSPEGFAGGIYRLEVPSG